MVYVDVDADTDGVTIGRGSCGEKVLAGCREPSLEIDCAEKRENVKTKRRNVDDGERGCQDEDAFESTQKQSLRP